MEFNFDLGVETERVQQTVLVPVTQEAPHVPRGVELPKP